MNLFKRVRDEQDRRVVRIHLLKEGERIIEEVIEKRQALFTRHTWSDFNTEEVSTFIHITRKIT